MTVTAEDEDAVKALKGTEVAAETESLIGFEI